MHKAKRSQSSYCLKVYRHKKKSHCEKGTVLVSLHGTSRFPEGTMRPPNFKHLPKVLWKVNSRIEIKIHVFVSPV